MWQRDEASAPDRQLSSSPERRSGRKPLAGASFAANPKIGPAGSPPRRVVAARDRQSWMSASARVKTMMSGERPGSDATWSASTSRRCIASSSTSRLESAARRFERKSGVSRKSVSGREELGGRRIHKQKKKNTKQIHN